MTNSELIEQARRVLKPRATADGVQLGYVGCALLSKSGKVFTGVSIHAHCGVGFCAEHSAIAWMVTTDEERIQKLVAVGPDGNVVAPCGRCRELIYQVDEANSDCEIIFAPDRVVLLRDLLPNRWRDLD